MNKYPDLKKLSKNSASSLRAIYSGRKSLKEIDLSKADFLQYLEYVPKYEMVFLTEEAQRILGYK